MLTETPIRTRPKLGHLISGALLVWAGASAFLAGTTTVGAGPAMAIALTVTGVAIMATLAVSKMLQPNPDVLTAAEPESF